MKFIEVTELGEKIYLNVNHILYIEKCTIDILNKESKKIIKEQGTKIVLQSIIDGTFRKEFQVEEKYEAVCNMIYFSDE